MKRNLFLAAILISVLLLVPACGFLFGQGPVTGEDSSFIVYFIDVGQADSALVICDGETMLIDGGNAADSDLIYAFLENHGVSHLDYIVATHAHEDHVGGLAGALNYATAGVALCPVTEYNSNAFRNFVKYLDEQEVAITVPNPGDTFMLGSAQVLIVGPLKPSGNPNNTSLVIKTTYGATSFLFTGDAERPEEEDILAAGYDISATVLKVGHHGSDTSTIYPFLREIMPLYAVITCGKGNSYGHPHDNLLSRLRDVDATVFRTDLQGTITCASDGKTVSFTTERNANIQTNPTEKDFYEEYYIGNINSRKFHRPSCSSLPNEINRVILDTWEAAIEEGFDPCGICKP
ncbi:MAG: MBL fold metallo-hydrolase [Clostridiales bacterium]|nr:MBL fold metallo-hydrolase [Clostridiales bacterium]